MLVNRRWGRLQGRPAIGSVAAVLLVVPLLLALAMPAFGAAAKKLSDPSVSPRSGTTTTKITFEVTYSRPLPPVFVRVVIAGKNHAMTRVSGGDWSGKDQFRFSGKLAKGTHDVLFQGSGVKDLPAGTVKITAEPAPTPKAHTEADAQAHTEADAQADAEGDTEAHAQTEPDPCAQPDRRPRSAPTPTPNPNPRPARRRSRHRVPPRTRRPALRRPRLSPAPCRAPARPVDPAAADQADRADRADRAVARAPSYRLPIPR